MQLELLTKVFQSPSPRGGLRAQGATRLSGSERPSRRLEGALVQGSSSGCGEDKMEAEGTDRIRADRLVVMRSGRGRWKAGSDGTGALEEARIRRDKAGLKGRRCRSSAALGEESEGERKGRGRDGGARGKGDEQRGKAIAGRAGVLCYMKGQKLLGGAAAPAGLAQSCHLRPLKMDRLQPSRHA